MTATIPSSHLAAAVHHTERALRAGSGLTSITASPDSLACRPDDAPEYASYTLTFDSGRFWVSLVTPDRYLSQSIEQDLVHTGDKLDDLLEEELNDLGFEVAGGRKALAFEHFRSESKLFTFRTPLPVDAKDASPEEIGRIAAVFLRAYEACFRRLGGMAGGDDE